MGFQTNISILNDHFDWIEKNPKTFVKAIKYGMNNGTDSFVEDALEARRAEQKGEDTYNPHWHESSEERQARVHYVTVHRAQHMDVPQVTFTHQNSTFDVYDYARGFELESPRIARSVKFHLENAKRIAQELRRQASYLERAVERYEIKAEES